ncbi:hypothetical protein LINPERHAP2_LOCUS22053, partial [Linum perenne]
EGLLPPGFPRDWKKVLKRVKRNLVQREKKAKVSDTSDDDDSQETNSSGGGEDGMLYEEPNDDTSNQGREE